MIPQATERARAELRAFNQEYELLNEVNPSSSTNFQTGRQLKSQLNNGDMNGNNGYLTS